MTQPTLKASIAAAVAIAAIAGFAGGGPALAGEASTTASITVNYQFDESYEGSAESLSQAEADATDPELFLRAEPTPLDISNGGMCTEDATATSPGTPGRWEKSVACGFVEADGSVYDFGISMVPDRFFVDGVNCFENVNSVAIFDAEPTITPAPFEDWECYVNIEPKPLVFIDKAVIFDDVCAAFDDEETCLEELDLSWDSSDFELEIYDSEGEQVAFDDPIIDPSNDECEPDIEFEGPFFADASAGSSLLPVDDSLCVGVPLAPGDYTMGEVLPSHGYEPAFSYCTIASPGGDEMLPEEDYSFTVSSRQSETTFCVLVNEYLVQTVTADLVIDGDDLGPAAPADFVISVTRDGDGEVVATGFDPEPGVDNESAEFTLPVGAYSLGVSAPDGYTPTVELAAVNVGRLQAASAANADSVGHEFTLSRSTQAAAVITVTYAVATTATTTTTTTTVAPTTAAPVTTDEPAVTTIAPTTTVTANLPATGSDGGQTTSLLLLALGLLVLGSGSVVVSRRS